MHQPRNYLEAASPHNTRGSVPVNPVVLPGASGDPPIEEADPNASIDSTGSVESLESCSLDLVVSYNPDIPPSGHVEIDELVIKGLGSTDGPASIDGQVTLIAIAVIDNPEGRRQLHETAERILSDPGNALHGVTMSQMASILRSLSTTEIAAFPYNGIRKTKAVQQKWLYERMGADNEVFTERRFMTRAHTTGPVSANQVVQAVAYLVCLALVSSAFVKHNAPVNPSSEARFEMLEVKMSGIQANMSGMEQQLGNIVELLQQQRTYRPASQTNEPRSRGGPSTPGNPVHSLPTSPITRVPLSLGHPDDGSEVSCSSTGIRAADAYGRAVQGVQSTHGSDAWQMANLLVGLCRIESGSGFAEDVVIAHNVLKKIARMIMMDSLPASDGTSYFTVGAGRVNSGFSKFYAIRTTNLGLFDAFNKPLLPCRESAIVTATTEGILQGDNPLMFQILLTYLLQKIAWVRDNTQGGLCARVEARIVMAYYLMRLAFVHHRLDPTIANCKALWDKIFPSDERKLNDAWIDVDEVFGAFTILCFVCIKHRVHMPCSRCSPAPIALTAKPNKLLSEAGYKAFKEAEAAAAPLKLTAQEFLAMPGNSKFKSKQVVSAASAPSTAASSLSYYLTPAGQNFCLPV